MNNLTEMPDRRLLMPFWLLIFMFSFQTALFGQEKPPKPIIIRVSTLQHLSFGSFVQTGTSGTVTVTHDGLRTATGNVFLPYSTSTVTPALFEVESIPGTLVTILNGPDTSLHGNNGGNLILKIGDSSTGSQFLTTGERTDVFIGGTLTIGSISANPAGDYNGIFQVTFIQQ